MRKATPYSLLAPVLTGLLCACSGGGGGGGGSPAPAAPAGFRYPSAANSIFQASPAFIAAGSLVTVTATIKDQKGADFFLGGKWIMIVKVDSCASCTPDSPAASAPVRIGATNQYQFSFTPSLTAAYAVTVLFADSSYASDFPPGVASDLTTAGPTLPIPAFNLCLNSAPGPAGLRQTSGSRGSGYAICSAQDLAVASGTFFLGQALYLAAPSGTIDMAPYYQSGGPEFSIGNDCSDESSCAPFTGTFTGNSVTIAGFRRTRGLGLFGAVEGNLFNTQQVDVSGVIEYLALVGSSQEGTSGGAVASSLGNGAVIDSVTVSGSTVTGSGAVGGLAGTLSDSRIWNSFSSASVASNGSLAGSLAAYATGASEISQSSATGPVTLASSVPGRAGGLVGLSDGELALFGSFYSGSVSAGPLGLAGGLVGRLYGTIKNSYATGKASGGLGAGGLVGETDPSYANQVTDSFVAYFDVSQGPAAAVAYTCNSLNVNGFFAGASLPECASQAAYERSGLPAGSGAAYTSQASIMAILQPILTGAWLWEGNAARWATINATNFPGF